MKFDYTEFEGKVSSDVVNRKIDTGSRHFTFAEIQEKEWHFNVNETKVDGKTNQDVTIEKRVYDNGNTIEYKTTKMISNWDVKAAYWLSQIQAWLFNPSGIDSMTTFVRV